MRLPNFDYTRPFYYLVTLKAVKGLAPFCRIVAPGVTTSSPITKAFHLVVGAFVAKWNCVEKIEPFVIMPDHVHFIIKLQKAEKPISLPRLVWLLARDFSRAYWECGAAERPAAKRGKLPRLKNPLFDPRKTPFLTLEKPPFWGSEKGVF
jgi:hypothetical protein